jgi:hypothetical protein
LVVSSLLSLVETVIQDPAAKAAFVASPKDFLSHHGFGDLDPADVDDAVMHAADTFPPTVAAQIVGVDGLHAAAHLDLHELGIESLDNWSGIDHGVLHAETPADPAPDAHDPFHGDVDFDRPVVHDTVHDTAYDTVDDQAPHEAGEDSLTVANGHAEAFDGRVGNHDGALDHSSPDHALISEDAGSSPIGDAPDSADAHEPSFVDASFHEAIADSTHEPQHDLAPNDSLHGELLHDDSFTDDGLGLGEADDGEPDDFEIG